MNQEFYEAVEANPVIAAVKNDAGLQAAVAVSYTHLDVYKRQIMQYGHPVPGVLLMNSVWYSAGYCENAGRSRQKYFRLFCCW